MHDYGIGGGAQAQRAEAQIAVDYRQPGGKQRIIVGMAHAAAGIYDLGQSRVQAAAEGKSAAQLQPF